MHINFFCGKKNWSCAQCTVTAELNHLCLPLEQFQKKYLISWMPECKDVSSSSNEGQTDALDIEGVENKEHIGETMSMVEAFHTLLLCVHWLNFLNI